MKVLKVKEYNKKQKEKYREAVKKWDNTKGGFPNLCFYCFYTPQGTERKRGLVIIKDNSHYFRLTRKEVIELKKELKNEKNYSK